MEQKSRAGVEGEQLRQTATMKAVPTAKCFQESDNVYYRSACIFTSILEKAAELFL